MATEETNAEKEQQGSGWLGALTTPCWTVMQQMAAWHIDTSEQIVQRALEMQPPTNLWVKGTPWASVLHEQQTLATRWLAESADVARRWWQLEQQPEASDTAQAEPGAGT